MPRTDRTGFSLIEALVSLVIAAVLLLSVYEVHQAVVQAQLRSQRALALADTQRNVLTHLEDLNPMEQGEGERSLANGAVLRWRSTPVGEERPNVLPNGIPGAYSVQVFEIVARVEANDGRAMAELTIQRLGWRQTYSALSDEY